MDEKYIFVASIVRGALSMDCTMALS